MSTEQALSRRPPSWPPDETWPPRNIDHMRKVLKKRMPVGSRLFAWTDQYGRIFALRSSSRDLTNEDSPGRTAQGMELAEVPIEILEQVQQRPNSWGYTKRQGWKERFYVRFTASIGQAYANGIDYIEVLVVDVPDGVERVRLERNREELWLPKSEDGLFMLRLRSSLPVRATISLVDARFWTEAPEINVQFIPPREPLPTEGS